MSQPAKVWVALPAYNEAANLTAVVERWVAVLRRQGCPHRIIVVDDGSTDGTGTILAELAARHPIDVLTHEQNQGLGPTISHALSTAAARAAPDDVIVTMDADNTHPPELFPEMANLLKRDGLEVVIASRYRRGARIVGLSVFRRLTMLGGRALFRLVLPIRGVRDYTCGYRAYRAGCLQQALAVYRDGFCRERSFACMAEILLNLARIGARCGEVPLTLRYDIKGGPSKMRVGSTVRRTLALIVRQRLTRRAGPPRESASQAPETNCQEE